MTELTINEDFTIEQLRLGCGNSKKPEPPKEEKKPEKEKPKKAESRRKRVIGKPVAVAQEPPEPEQPKMYVVRGFSDRVHEYMKRRGFKVG